MSYERSAGSERIAVIGMSGRYSGCNSLDELWECLRAGRDCVTSIPERRQRLKGFYASGSARRRVVGGFIDGVEEFDAEFFDIAAREAEEMDPQHRLFLQEAYRTFEDAGCSARSYGSSRCGVYLGIMNSEYGRILAAERNDPSLLYSTGQSYAIAAARVAYHLNLKGPAIAVDTTCSSSSVAVHLARQALLNHEIDMALAGGVSLNLTHHAYGEADADGSDAGMIPCRPFDERAAGIVPGEGVGCVLLKRLSDAERDRDNIHGVILGTSVNHNGTNSGITVPSVRSLMALLGDFYRHGEIDPETITYLEAHGTGTKFGDAIELDALTAAFRSRTTRKQYCAVGSIKGNIGHGNAAAGIAGLHKTLLLMKHGSYVPTINYEKPNQLVDLSRSAFYVNTELREWEPGGSGVRRAGINCVGAGGTNAHMVVEEYTFATPGLSADELPHMIVLSARDRDRLRVKVEDLLKFVRCNGGAGGAGLANLAHTLRAGRDEMKERLGFVVTSWSQLSLSLENVLRGERSGITGLASTEHVEDGAGESDRYTQAVRRWVGGDDAAWPEVCSDSDVGPRKVSLPAYPFYRRIHWVGGEQGAGGARHGNGTDSAALVAPGEQELRLFLRKTIAEISKVPVTGITDETDYFDLGLSSRQLVLVANAIGDRVRRPFVSGVLFDVRTIRDLAAAIVAGSPADEQRPEGPKDRVLSALQNYSRGQIGLDDLIDLVGAEETDDQP